MKKLTALFFLTIISLHFVACTAYASNVYCTGAVKLYNLQGLSTNAFLQFEGNDVLEEDVDSNGADLIFMYTSALNTFNFVQRYVAFCQYQKNDHSSGALYLSNRALRI
jgi:hypothetical protein